MVWSELGTFLHRTMGRPDRMLDPTAGMCEFINKVPSKERWAVDMNEAFIRSTPMQLFGSLSVTPLGRTFKGSL